ncbi:MAG TPA: hypothetical protein VIJ63_04990 [Roseiarcus sp.]
MVHVMHVMVMMMMVVMMMVMGHRRFGIHRRASGRRAGRRFLRDGVASEAERENGRGGKGLDHGRIFLWLGNPNGSQRSIEVAA